MAKTRPCGKVATKFLLGMIDGVPPRPIGFYTCDAHEEACAADEPSQKRKAVDMETWVRAACSWPVSVEPELGVPPLNLDDLRRTAEKYRGQTLIKSLYDKLERGEALPMGEIEHTLAVMADMIDRSLHRPKPALAREPDDASAPVHDPDLYRRLSEPFEDEAEAEAALTAFHADLRRIRAKHGIPDLVVAWRINIASIPNSGAALGNAQMGDELHAESIAAWLFGKLQQERKRAIADLLAANGGRAR